LWIDGVEKIRNVDYTIKDGSTIITLMSKTIVELDNGSHTAAAVFTKVGETVSGDNDGNEFEVIAQNFSTNINKTSKPVDNGSVIQDGTIPLITEITEEEVPLAEAPDYFTIEPQPPEKPRENPVTGESPAAALYLSLFLFAGSVVIKLTNNTNRRKYQRSK
jgi:hypothetical protein